MPISTVASCDGRASYDVHGGRAYGCSGKVVLVVVVVSGAVLLGRDGPVVVVGSVGCATVPWVTVSGGAVDDATVSTVDDATSGMVPRLVVVLFALMSTGAASLLSGFSHS